MRARNTRGGTTGVQPIREVHWLAARGAMRGYTLIELLVVLAIILGMMSLVMTSVSSMLQSSRMSRTLALFVGAVDEARTNAISQRRSTKLDLTRIDAYLDKDGKWKAEGKLNRLTTSEPSLIDNFDSYPDTDGSPPALTPGNNGWKTTDSFYNNSSATPSIYYDGTRCLRMRGGSGGNTYWNLCSRMDTVQQEDFEQIVMARVKFMPQATRTGARKITVYAALQTSGKMNTVTPGYFMTLTITPTTGGMNQSSTAQLGGGSINTSQTPPVNLEASGNPSPTTCLIENVWYRVSLSVKRSTNLAVKPTTSMAIVAGKVWADGQLEPQAWTVGPARDSNPLYNGPGGFFTSGGDALLDDVLIDGRAIRVVPEGLRVDAIDPTTNPGTDPTTVIPVADDSPYSFPVQFRPDGTTAQKYILRLRDISSGSAVVLSSGGTTAPTSYVTIDQNTGRARLSTSLKDALK